ncbi:MAG TPA: hypothetical protein ENN75_00725 [candidate division Zixibacteria bacterium]|nr:hypothetical protein [candidate division Zixibacteria bacterium]
MSSVEDFVSAFRLLSLSELSAGACSGVEIASDVLLLVMSSGWEFLDEKSLMFPGELSADVPLLLINGAVVSFRPVLLLDSAGAGVDSILRDVAGVETSGVVLLRDTTSRYSGVVHSAGVSRMRYSGPLSARVLCTVSGIGLSKPLRLGIRSWVE